MEYVRLESQAGLRQQITVLHESGTPQESSETGATFEYFADEPKSLGGGGSAPTAYEYLLVSLAACTSITLRMYADRKGIPLKHLTVEVKHDKREGEEGQGKVDWFYKDIFLQGDLSDEQVERLHEIADKCPVSRTLLKGAKMETTAKRS